jgi:ABC-2 type transport system permease protein
MNINRIYAIFIRQIYLIRGNPTRFFQMFVWVTLDMLQWGFLSIYLNKTGDFGFSLISMFLGAVILWNFLLQIMQGISMAFFEDVWSRNFLNVFGSPLKMSEYITGMVLIGTVRGIIALITIMTLSSLFFGFSAFTYGSYLSLFILNLFFFGIALGIVGISIVLRFGPAAEWFVWPIPAFLAPFVGVVYPLATLPGWMQVVGKALPPSYVFDGVRTIVNGGAFPVATLAWASLLSLGYLFLAYLIFYRVYRRVIRTGLIARYSAENVV